jgi:hypothetical protein
MPVVQLHARARSSHRPLQDFADAASLWARLRAAVAEPLACVVLPAEVLLVAAVSDPPALRAQLCRMLSEPARGPTRARWRDVPAPTPLSDATAIEATIRSIVLRPCKTGLCDDPMDWVWSTHRDVMGAVADPWITAEQLADALGRHRRSFAREHHRFVTSSRRKRPHVVTRPWTPLDHPGPGSPGRLA